MNRFFRFYHGLTVLSLALVGWLVVYYINMPFSSPSLTNIVVAQTSDVDWPQLQHDAQHTGRTTSFVVPNYQVAWAWIDKNHLVKNFVSAPGKSLTDGFEQGFKFTVIVAEQVQPIVAEGKVFFGAMNGIFYAVDALTGDNRWDFTTGGPILGTAAYASNVVIFGSMDGKVYGLNSANGSLRWSYQTGAGINNAPIIFQNNVYVGSRDGKFYALDISTGQLKWSYSTRVEPVNPNSPFNLAPIVAPAAVTEDGGTVFFGAENMYFYALNTSNGTERWPPKKLVGQSFLYTWPVVKGNRVIVTTMSSLRGAEAGGLEPDIELVLDSLSTNPTWTQEKTAILNYLTQNPTQKIMYVFDVATGQEPYQVAMGRVTGDNKPPYLSVVDNQDRLLTYWRSKRSTLFQDQGSFGSKYCPDISTLNLTTGDRITLPNPNPNRTTCPELDNGFQPTVGGDYLYLHSQFRGAKVVNLVTGVSRGISENLACQDGACWRGGECDGCWGYQIMYYGNDNQPTLDTRPPRIYENAAGFAGIATATIGGKSLLYVNEGAASAIVAIEHKP